MQLYLFFTAVGIAGFTLAIVGLVWLIRQGQLDDLDTPALRMLHDDGICDTPSQPGPLP